MSASQSSGPDKRAWIALLLPPFAWMLFEYGLGISLRGDCDAVGRWLGPVWGIASLLACLAALVVAWAVVRKAGRSDRPTGSWLARIALLGAAVFALAIGFQTLATLIVPSCAR